MVLVLALRGIADNFAASVVLQARHPIALGDEIESGDFVGVVTELNGRSVVIRTVDGRTVHVPNGEILQERLVNNSTHGARRSEIASFTNFGRATFDSARQALDYDFLFRNPDYRHLIATIDTEGFHWIDFGLSDEAKLGLFARGVEAAATFLRQFDWDAYKEIRRGLMRASVESKKLDAAKGAAPVAP